MHIFITGGTGFIGQALCTALIEQGHQLTLLSRQPRASTQAVTFCQNLNNFANFNGFDAVINLAGEPIFERAWRTEQKAKLRSSRLDLTQKLVKLIQQSDNPPHTFLSGSATGYYGSLPFSFSGLAEKGDEQTACGTQFPAELCKQWEAVALKAQSPKTRVCLLRTGLVLAQHGGALTRMLPLYRFGLGGKLGNGRQHWAWISLADQVRASLFLLYNPISQGVYNLVAPEPVPQRTFNRLLAQTLRRPAFCHVPALLLKAILGERSQLLLDNQPLVPQKLLDEGFEFQHHSLADFLKNL